MSHNGTVPPKHCSLAFFDFRELTQPSSPYLTLLRMRIEAAPFPLE